MNQKTPGWQQPAVPVKPAKPACLHLSLLGASLTLSQHPVGHTYVCTCGTEFVVRLNEAGAKKFQKRIMR